jgi:hypothetical protein
MWEKLRRKDTVCHEKLILKIMWEKEKMTYVVHACIDIASLKTLHEKPLGKTHKGRVQYRRYDVLHQVMSCEISSPELSASHEVFSYQSHLHIYEIYLLGKDLVNEAMRL